MAIDRERGGLVMFENDLQAGSEVQLMRRSIDFAYVGRRSDELLARLEGRRPFFALYIDCAGRAADVNGFIGERVEQFRAACDARALRLEFDADPHLNGAELFIDREQFDKLVFNLLSNAEKFTEAGAIRVATEHQPNGFTLTVSDTGVGIPLDQVPHIFDRFRQAEGGAARRYGGTGLGLAWVREVARLHGGTVTVTSEPGSGTTFRVFVPFGRAHLDPSMVVEAHPGETSPRFTVRTDHPLTAAELASLNEAADAAFDVARPTIVYAEDNQDLREYVRSLLAPSYNVFLAVDGVDAMEKIERYKPDLILTDEMMPRLTGRGLVEAIRADPGRRSTPVIVVTARSGAQARIEALEAGADDYGSTFEEDVVRIEPGDVLVMFSDGITEALSAGDEEFGDDRLAALVAPRRTEPAAVLVDGIISAVTLHARGMPQGDDMTVGRRKALCVIYLRFLKVGKWRSGVKSVGKARSSDGSTATRTT
jgi:CheY-like chemotaxis protein